MTFCRLNFIVWSAVTALTMLLLAAALAFDGKEPWTWLESYGNASRIGPVENWVNGKPPTTHYSERIYWDDFFRTRANTWSNITFLIVGFYALSFGWRDLQTNRSPLDGYLARTPLLSFLFGFGCVALGFGSSLYHASLTRLGQQLDVTTMWMPLIGLIAIYLGRWVPRIRLGRGGKLEMAWITTILFFVFTILFYHYLWEWSAKRILLSLIGIVAAFGIVDLFWRSRRMQVRWMFLAGFFLAPAFLCRQLDSAGRFSGPDDWWQGHALWHVFAALCLFSMYVYLRSEQIRREDPASSTNPTVP